MIQHCTTQHATTAGQYSCNNDALSAADHFRSLCRNCARPQLWPNATNRKYWDSIIKYAMAASSLMIHNRHEDQTAVTQVFWNVTPCRLVNSLCRLKGSYCLQSWVAWPQRNLFTSQHGVTSHNMSSILRLDIRCVSS